jgi:peptidoglycan/LPS O-acetylase OafA/YrhL
VTAVEAERAASPAQSLTGGHRRPAGRHARPRSDPRSPAYRADIEGLRAVAVLGVLIYHAGAPFLPGGFVGVDVFFVISGYLITGLIHEEIAATGRLSLPRFYARRVKRLLPAGAAVLTLTAIASSFLLPPLQRSTVGTDIVWSALYGANWRFAVEQTDYLNQDALPSPVLHYWSLAVEEQYYLVWPVLLAVLGALAIRRRASLRFSLFSAMALLGAVSFALSLHLTQTNQPFAFFGTPARVWELAVGGCLALAAPHLGRIRPFVRAIAGWLGLAAILGSMLVLEETGPFPGTAALWPTLGTAAVLFAGTTARSRTPRTARNGPAMVLDRGFMRHTGRISYSLYLWHWPPLVIVAAVLDQETLSFGLGLVVLAVTWPVAWLSWALLEEPFRRSRSLSAVPRRAFGLFVICTTATLASAMLLFTSGGATSLDVEQVDGTVVRVDPASAVKDFPLDQTTCMQSSNALTPEVCSYGPADAEHTVVLWGDSHAYQWRDAVAAMAEERGWRLDVYSKAGCSAAEVTVWLTTQLRAYDECVEWRQKVRDTLIDGERPDAVLVTSRSNTLIPGKNKAASPENSLNEVADGWESVFRDLVDADIATVALGPIPDADVDVPTCLSEHQSDPEQCGFKPHVRTLEVQAIELGAERVPGVEYVDTISLVCPGKECLPVQHGAVVYRDSNHLTRAFVEKITPDLAAKVEKTDVFDTGADTSQA